MSVVSSGGSPDGGSAVPTGASVVQDGVSVVQDDVPAPAAGLQLIGQTPGSGYRRPPSLVRRADGQMLQLTSLLYRTLDAVDGQRDYDEIAAHVSAGSDRSITGADA
ncbi:MAG: putative peptide zinc metalloprotease protein, partial [Pseudonocardiales bacterium]|nr:putative peptide zinc metalloprotease protein [Pseudonocardiales bacterium]